MGLLNYKKKIYSADNSVPQQSTGQHSPSTNSRHSVSYARPSPLRKLAAPNLKRQNLRSRTSYSSYGRNESSSSRPNVLSFLDNYTIHPHGMFDTCWDTLHILVLAYICLIDTYVLAFISPELYRGHYLYYIDRATDIFYLMDILFKFMTGFIEGNNNHSIVRSKLAIASRYLRTSFLSDLFIAAPWDEIFYALFNDELQQQIPTVAHIVRLGRLVKIIRFFKINELVDVLEDRYGFNRNQAKMVQLLLTIGLLAHFSACGFYFISTIESDELNWTNADRNAHLNFTPNTPNIIKYLTSLYWAVTMMATVGFGDIVPVTPLERLYTLLDMLISAGAYAFTIASLSSIVDQLTVSKSKYYEKLNELNQYMVSRHVPPALQFRARQYHRYYLKRRTVYNEMELLLELPTRVRQEITEHYVQETIRDTKFLQFVEKDFVVTIAFYLKPTYCPYNEVIIKKGEGGDELFIITKGVMQVFQLEADNSCCNIAYLTEGDHFGEMALLLEDQQGKRNANVRAKSYTELYSLDYQYMTVGLNRYNGAKKTLLEIALQRKALLENNALLANLHNAKIKNIT